MFNQKMGHLIKALILSFFTTALLIVIFAYFMFKLSLSENVIAIGVIAIYIISCGLGGFFIGKTIKEKKFMWGFLVGLIYFLVLLIISVIAGGDGNMLFDNGMSVILLCLGGGTLGGMLA